MKQSLLFFFSVFFINVAAFAEASFGKLSYIEAVNISGRQRMLSQRIVKNHLIFLTKKTSEETFEEYSLSLIEFKANLKLLKTNSDHSNKKIKQLLALEKETYGSFLNELSFDEDQNFDKLKKLSKQLLRVCDNLVSAIEEEGKMKVKGKLRTFSESQLRTTNISGKQRMLSQKLAANILFSILKKEKIVGNNEIIKIREEQREALNYLVFSSLNDDYTNRLLGNISWKYENLDKYLENKKPLEVKEALTITNKISNLYEAITAKYTRLYNDKNIARLNKYK